MERGLNARCTVCEMSRAALRSLVGVGLLGMTLAVAGPAWAAGEVVVAVAPTRVTVGQPVEVLVRTFRVVEQSDLSLPFEPPIQPYPVASGAWNILYTWQDYPFDVVAQHEDGTVVRLTLARDQADATVWRGVVLLPEPGTWTIWVRNFPDKEPGSTASVTVDGGPSASAETASNSTTPASAIDARQATIIGALLGLLGGLLIGRLLWRQRPAT